MISKHDILETIQMLDGQNLDIRTVTCAINLSDCVSDSPAKLCVKVYDKIASRAEKLVRVSEEISAEYGVPIVNKRVSVTPIANIGAAARNYVQLAKTLDRAAETLGIDFIGGYSALVHKGTAAFEKDFLESIPEALSATKKVCSSVNAAATKAGINMDAVKTLGRLIKQTAYNTRDKDGIGCAKFVVFCNSVEDNPFMAGAYSGFGEGDAVINVGVSGPGVVHTALQKFPSASLDEAAEIIKRTAFKITRVGSLVAREAARRMGAEAGIVDLSLAPTPKAGDSVAHILEELGLSYVGAHGTTAALALLNDAVKKGGLMACGTVGGLSGAFIPVSEDIGMITAAQKGFLTFDKLEAMTSVCSVGLDMIAVPGDTPEEVISAIIADECAIGMVNNKTTAVRLIPVWGKSVGQCAEFGGLLGSAPIISLNLCDPSRFINRGGRIPAPVHSNKN